MLGDLPAVKVSPEMVINAVLGAGSVLKMRLALLPLMVMTFAPGPLIVTAWLIAISPVVSVIVPLNPDLKSTVSAPAAAFALLMQSRSESAPLSFRFRAVNVAGAV